MILEAPIFHFEDPPAVSGGSSVDKVNSGIEDNCEKSCLKPSITMPSPVLLGSAAMQIRCDFCKRHAQGNFFYADSQCGGTPEIYRGAWR